MKCFFVAWRTIDDIGFLYDEDMKGRGVVGHAGVDYEMKNFVTLVIHRGPGSESSGAL